jgi:hypothetical protein
MSSLYQGELEICEHKLSKEVLMFYWNTLNDHDDFRKILQAIDHGGGQTIDISGVIRELHKAGYGIVRL